MRRRWLPLLLAALLAGGCSCERRMARLERLCPECFERDTLHLVDTVVPPPVTFFEHLGWDMLSQNGVYVLERPDASFSVTVSDGGVDIEGALQPDTVILERQVPVEVPCPPEKKEQPWLLIGIMAVLVILVLVDTLKPRK